MCQYVKHYSIDITGGTTSLTIPKLKNMEECLVSPHWLVTTRITPSFPFSKTKLATSFLNLTQIYHTRTAWGYQFKGLHHFYFFINALSSVFFKTLFCLICRDRATTAMLFIYIPLIPVMATVAMRKKVVSIGQFSPSFYLQSLQIFLFVRSNPEQLYVLIALKIREK